MDTAQLIAFMLYAVTATVTPGPNNFMLMMSGNLFGWRATLPHMVGVIAGFSFMLVCAVYGLTALLQEMPWLTWGVRIVGTAWLAWLGVKFILAALRPAADNDAQAPSSKTAARPLRIYEAMVFQWANPKSLVVATSCASAFITLAPTPLERSIIIAGGFALAGLISTSTWTLAGSAISALLSTSQHAKTAQISMGVLMVLTALSLLVI